MNKKLSSTATDDLVSRIQPLVRQLADLSPYYLPILKIANDQVWVEHQPRYPGAEKKRPITLTLNIAMPLVTPEDQARVEKIVENVMWGEQVQFAAGEVSAHEDGPFSLPIPESRWTIGRVENTQKLPPARLLLVDSEESLVRALPALLDRAVAVPGGFALEAFVGHGYLKVIQRFDPKNGIVTCTFRVQHDEPIDAHALLPILQFLAVFREPYSAVLEINGSRIGAPMPLSDQGWVSPGFIETVRACRDLSEKSGVAIQVPGSVSDDDLEALRFATSLYDGESVALEGRRKKFRIIEPNRESFPEREDSFAVCLVPEKPVEVTLFGQQIPLGPTYVYSPNATLINGPQVRGALRDRRRKTITLDVAFDEGAEMQITRGVPPHLRKQQSTRSSPEGPEAAPLDSPPSGLQFRPDPPLVASPEKP